MPKRATYYSDAVIKAIDHQESTESFSGRVGFLALSAVLSASEYCPALTSNEWCALADANNGTAHSYDVGPEAVVSGMLHNLFDSSPECDEKWRVNCTDLAKKISGMPFTSRFAAFEVVRRFWVHGDVVSSSQNYAEAFRKLGASVST